MAKAYGRVKLTEDEQVLLDRGVDAIRARTRRLYKEAQERKPVNELEIAFYQDILRQDQNGQDKWDYFMNNVKWKVNSLKLFDFEAQDFEKMLGLTQALMQTISDPVEGRWPQNDEERALKRQIDALDKKLNQPRQNDTSQDYVPETDDEDEDEEA